MKTSKLPPKPESVVDPDTGRRTYAGSLSALYVDLTASQKAEVLKQLREKPHFPSELSIPHLSPFNPHSGEAVRRYIEDLSKGGTVQLVKTPKAKR